MERLELTVAPAQAGRTVHSLMRRELAMAEGLISSAKFRPDGILLNGCRARVTERVCPGDVLSVDIADRGRNTAAPLDIPVDILWEDGYLAVISKPAGVSIYGEGMPNMAGILAYRWGENIEFHPVNRLDVGTTGLFVAARDGYTHDRLRRMLHTEDFRREYLAVVEGTPSPPEGDVELPIGKTPAGGARRGVEPGGLPSRTAYRVLERTGARSLLLLRLYTGRTHQIRVHMSAMGHPLVGDRLYGASDLALSRPALHSHRILLAHPVTGERIEVTAPLPPDMAALTGI